MRLYHLTPACNVDSIQRLGLRLHVPYAGGPFGEVCATPDAIWFFDSLVGDMQLYRGEGLCVIEVEIPEQCIVVPWIEGGKHTYGWYYSECEIPSTCIVRVRKWE